MAKKHKEKRHREKSNDESNSGSSNIFKSLFGDILQQDASVSIFSEDNPFRRKPSDRFQTPQEPPQQHLPLGSNSGSVEEIENPKTGDSEKADCDKLTKGNRKKGKKRSFNSVSVDEAAEIPLTAKKSKGVEAGDEGGDANVEPKELSKKGREGKKKSDIESDEISKEQSKESPNLGIKSMKLIDEEGDTSGTVSSGIRRKDKEQEKKKKRKRDEVEAEYEARRYGAMAAKEEGEGGLGGGVVGEKRKKLDNPEDMMVSKEGFDDEDKLLRTIFVGNLPLKVKKKALLREFGQFGEVESVRLRSIPLSDTKVPRKGAIIKKQINDSVDSVHAYIVFKTEESAQSSLAHNMAVVGGNHIRVDRACPPRKKLKGDNAPLPLYDSKRTVFLGNLPFDVKDEEIYQLFSGINNLESSIEAIRVIRDPHTSIGKGIGYILFKTGDAANLVVRKRNLKLRDRDLRLYHAKSNATPSKRKPAETGNSSAKKLAVDFGTPNSDNKAKAKASFSYQGTRASKSGVQKKVHPKTVEPLKSQSHAQKLPQPKERKTKRPAVAARKAKANARKNSGVSKQTGIKRKQERRTPDSGRQKKKARKFR